MDQASQRSTIPYTDHETHDQRASNHDCNDGRAAHALSGACGACGASAVCDDTNRQLYVNRSAQSTRFLVREILRAFEANWWWWWWCIAVVDMSIMGTIMRVYP